METPLEPVELRSESSAERVDPEVVDSEEGYRCCMAGGTLGVIFPMSGAL